MRHRYLLGYLIAAAMIMALGCTTVLAQADQGTKRYAPPSVSKDHSKPAPRTADGHPDLSGMWIEKYGALGTDPAAGKTEVPNRRSGMPAAYPSDELPYQPWAALKARQLHDAENTDPLLHCEPYGVPRIWGGPHPARLVQLPGELIILYERDTAFRIIPTDDAEGGVSFIQNDQLSGQLHQPCRVRAAPDARNAVGLAMQQRIGILSVVQLSGFQGRPGLIRQFVRRIGSGHTGPAVRHFRFSGSGIGSQRSVFLDPHSGEVWMSVSCARSWLGMILGYRRRRIPLRALICLCQNGRAAQSHDHRRGN